MSYDPITGMWVDDNDSTSNQTNETSENNYNNVENSGGSSWSNNDDKKKKDKKRMSLGRVVAIALVFGLAAGVAFQGIDILRDRISPGQVASVETVTTTPRSADDSTNTESSSDVVNVVKSCMPSIVSITNLGVEEVMSFFGGTSLQETESKGSGIIVGQSETELLIVTNNHVVENAETLTISFVNEDSVEGNIKGTDSENDLAVIAISLSKIKQETLEQIKIASIGNSDETQIGEQVIAIGNALGYGQSVTTGVVSAKDRTIENSDISAKLIQTDAAINPGNSGGALLNSAGELIGINVAKVASEEVESIGYAIPTAIAQPIIDELMNQQTREKVEESARGKLGIKCTDVSSTASEAYGIPTGVYVSEVESNSGAANAGIKKGDVITKFDGSSISTTQALTNKLQYYKKGETVKITIQRVGNNGKYKEQVLDVKLG